ncbi:MAG: HNH endonuclease [Actinobacteria bacterium]|nr:HNH endonuclease [Actinomycetota bacterium]
MLEVLQGIVSCLDGVLADLDPSLLHPRDASKLLAEFEAIERRAAAGKTVVAARATDAGEWARAGHRSPEDWLASASGTTYGQAAATLEASLKLGQLPALDAAVRSGELSAPTLAQIAPAATAENEERLVHAARTQGPKQLKSTVAKEKAARRSAEAEAARHRRIHNERYYRSWVDDEGAGRFEGKTTVDRLARIDAAIAAEAEIVFKEAYAAGRRESAGAYRLDALGRLLEGGGAKVETTVVVRVDETRLRGQGGTCASEAGPVPVELAIGEVLAGAFVKIVATDGTDIAKVHHVGRCVPAEVKTAVIERDGGGCVRPGCGSTHRLETHHYKVDFAKGGPTTYSNLATLCRFDHRLVTNGGHRLEGGPGDWKWIEPP